jgi:hypothetical protein
MLNRRLLFFTIAASFTSGALYAECEAKVFRCPSPNTDVTFGSDEEFTVKVSHF